MSAALTFSRQPQVRELEVFHPRIGAVYWEGPVQVDLTVSLTGETCERPLSFVPRFSPAACVWPVVVLVPLMASGRARSMIYDVESPGGRWGEGQVML